MSCNGPYHSLRIKAINSPPVRRSPFRCDECNGSFPSRQALLNHQNGPERRTPNRSNPQRYPRRHVQQPIMQKPEIDAPSNPSGRGVSPISAASSSRCGPYQRSRPVKREPDAKIEPKQEVASGNASPERPMAVKLELKEEVGAAPSGENNPGDELILRMKGENRI